MATGRKKDRQSYSNDVIRSSDSQIGGKNKQPELHIYRKREKVASYNKQKDELKTGEALIYVDYSESYNNTQQEEIQSAYFGQQNFFFFF